MSNTNTFPAASHLPSSIGTSATGNNKFNLGDALNSVLRIFGYQLFKKSPPGFRHDAKTRVGRFDIVIPAGNPLAVTYRESPQYSGELARLVAAVTGKYPTMSMIDVGANVGDTAAVARSTADLPILCIEGDPHTYKFLQKNIAQFDRVTARNAFLGERTETCAVKLEKAGWNTTVVPVAGSQSDSQALQIVTLDDVLRDHGGQSEFKLLKIDAEGYDTRIIRGAKNYIESVHPVIFMEYNRENMSAIGEDGLSTLLWLQEIGYDVVLFYEAFSRFILSMSLTQRDLLRQLHEYVDEAYAKVFYFDLCLFHRDDQSLAQAFVRSEEQYRASISSAKSGK